jgi:hypothetical protein
MRKWGGIEYVEKTGWHEPGKAIYWGKNCSKIRNFSRALFIRSAVTDSSLQQINEVYKFVEYVPVCKICYFKVEHIFTFFMSFGYVCSLFNDAVSISDHTMSNHRIMNWKRREWKRLWPNLKFYQMICQEVLRKPTKPSMRAAGPRAEIWTGTSQKLSKFVVFWPWRRLCGQYVKCDLGWCDSQVYFGFILYEMCIEMDRLGWLLLSKCLSPLQSGAMFHKGGNPSPWLANSSLSRFAKKERQGRWKRITLKPVGSLILFVMVSRVFLVVWASPLSVRQSSGKPACLPESCLPLVSSTTLPPLLASCATET